MKTVVSFCCICIIAAFALAQEKPSEADLAKMMADYEKLMTPGAEHALLGKFVGEWNIASQWWSSKDAQPMESHATNSTRWILNGRFLQSDFQGDMMGKPFHGLGLEGYDTFKKKYTMLWVDETATAMYTAEGTASPDGKTITYLGKHDDPFTGAKDLDVKYVGIIVDDNQHIFRIIEKPGTPDEYTAMEMIYTRK
jgi:hypothetical protein